MKFRVPFTFVLTFLTLVLSLVPATVIWAVFMDLMTSSTDLLKETTQDSTDTMAEGMQTLLINQAMEKLNVRLTEGENEMKVQAAMIQVSGLLDYDLRPEKFDIPGQILTPYLTRNFVTMKGHDYFSGMGISGAIWKNGSASPATDRLFWLQWSALYIDILSGALGQRTLYNSNLWMHPDEQLTTYSISYANQMSGKLVYTLQETTLPSIYIKGTFAASAWDTDLGFNSYSGNVEVSVWQWFAAQNDTWIQASISISAQTISAELATELTGSPNDRLVIFFRQPHGHMVAASHGKFFSHSDVNLEYVNVLDNPPNISAYHLWTCLQSNDTLIPLACQQLYSTYQSWPAIPVLNTEMVLNGERYWVATDHTTGNMKATVLMLKNRAAVMGQIDSSNARVDDQLGSRKGVTFIILGVVTAFAVLLPLSLGLWLAARLMRLAAGMDEIAKLQFDMHAPPTMFSELHRFQKSFIKMERGLQAFGKFVPQAVVKVLIAGDMNSNDRMSNETLTIMFADIEGFSTICEKVPPNVLVEVCTEYFEATCSSIVRNCGTIDKFIGDCIMALWNAPEHLPGHERAAITAALAMQTSVLELHRSWQQRGLPILKFRLGIHTGTCLVGNFGCSYRVSYTCLGDGVNLAARLEALNKKFGTFLCVSHATYEGCREDFHFRKLAKVTVPGKAEVLPVYEVLCARGVVSGPASPLGLSIDIPGAVSVNNGIEMTSDISDSPMYIRVQSGTADKQSNSGRSWEKELSDQVPYHWQYVNQQALLEQAEKYEAAYTAMVVGDLPQAHRLLNDQGFLSIADKAWAVLADQLKQIDNAQSWDGVFYFREK